MQTYKTIEEYMNSLDVEKKEQVQALRGYVLAVEPSLEEHIKWNAPSYVYNEVDRITFNLMNKQGLVKLVFHMGAKRKETKGSSPIMDDPYRVIEWVSDIRGYITFRDLEDVKSKKDLVMELVKRWLLVEQ